MQRFLPLAVIAACSAPPRPAPPAPTPPPGDPMVIENNPAPPAVAAPVPPPPPPAGSTRVTVVSSGAASRGPASPRALRRLIAAKQGAIEIAKGYSRVGLTITKIEAGTLDDPNYPKRPVGTNHLEVVLLDEAAFASDSSMANFTGTWTLTRTADGTLYVSAIADTPYDPKAAATRRALIDQARSGLHGGPDERLSALDILADHPFLQLVPDVIALLDDQRTGNAGGPPRAPSGRRPDYRRAPRIIGDAAEDTLRKLVQPFAAGLEPQDRDVGKWRSWWRNVLAGEPVRERVIAPVATTVLEIPMNQSWPDLVALPAGAFALSVDRLETPVDNHAAGLALSWPPYRTRTWIDPRPVEEVDAAVGPGGKIGVLYADGNDHWSFSVVQQGRAGPPVSVIANAKHAALAASAKDYLAIFIRDNERMLHAQLIDANGQPRGPAKDIPLPSDPAAWYHRLFHALKLVRRSDGWLAAVEIRGGVVVVSLDDKLALVAPPTQLASSTDFTQPKLVAGKQAFVVWTHGRHTRGQVGYALVKPDGTMASKPKMIGDEVWDVARPVSLDDGGFAVAWIEAQDEVHLGRWNAAGDFITSVIVVPRGASFLTLALARDPQGKIVVGYQDVMHYPYKLIALHVDPADVK